MSKVRKYLTNNKNKQMTSAYSTGQNVRYMISLALRRRPSVLVFALVISMTAILNSLAQLFIVPSVLRAVENKETVLYLSGIIILFTLSLMILGAAGAYFASCSQFGRVEVRLMLGEMIQNKGLTMSYPDIENQDVKKKKDKATMMITSNTAATESIWTTLTNLIRNIIEFVVCFLLLVNLNFYLILAVVVTTLISFFVTNYLNGWGYRHRDEESEYTHRMNYLSERSRDYSLAKDIRIFGMREWIGEVFSGVLRCHRSFVARGERIYFCGNLLDTFLTFARNAIIYYFLIRAVLHGDMMASQFVLYFNTVNVFTGGIGNIMNDLSTLKKQSYDISAVREFLEYPESFNMDSGLPCVADNTASYSIEFKNVHFRYPGASNDTLSNINLKIKPGEKLAIVGLNGAGKTTLIKLMCGFLDPTEGEVLLNDVNIKEFNRRDYYKLFSAVFQDYSVLDVTIEENVAQTDENVDEKLLWECIEKAGLTQKIKELPDGIKTHLGRVFTDGIDLSGGELQRLMLARALYKNSPIIVLDEPTSALDPIAESEIYKKYDQLTNGRMAVYISHRLASTGFCDRVILLEGGEISEEGTHNELLARGGRYAELFEIQSRYYREGGNEQ